MVFTYRPHVLPIIRFWKQAALTRGFDAQRIDDFIQVLLKEPETPMQSIKEEGKAILKEQGMSGGEQNKDEEAATMVANMDKLEKEEPGSTKKEKDAKEDKKAPLSAEEQKEFPKLPGMKLFEAQAGTAVEYDKAAAQKYKAEIEEKMKTLKDEAARLVGKKRKSQRAHARRAVAALKADQRYVDACKIVKGLKPKSHHFLTKEAVIPEAPIETKGPEEETEVASKKGSKKKTKKDKKAPLSAEEQKEFPKLPGEIEIYKAKLRTEFGYSNKDIKADPDLQEMESRIAAFQKRS